MARELPKLGWPGLKPCETPANHTPGVQPRPPERGLEMLSPHFGIRHLRPRGCQTSGGKLNACWRISPDRSPGQTSRTAISG